LLTGAAVVGLLAGAVSIGVWWLRPAPPPRTITSTSSILVMTSTVPATPETVPPSQAPPPPDDSVEVSKILANARSMMRAKNLTQAANPVAAASQKNSSSTSLRSLLQEIVQAAAKDTDEAQKAADRARAADRRTIQQSVYLTALSQQASANDAREKGRFTAAVA